MPAYAASQTVALYGDEKALFNAENVTNGSASRAHYSDSE